MLGATLIEQRFGGFQVAESEQEAIADAIVESPMPAEAAAVVEEYIPGPAELAVVDPLDRQEVMLAMDAHDVAMLLERVQSSALRKWVYELPNTYPPQRGLTVHAVQDVVQLQNWTGKCRIGVLPDSLEVERVSEDAGNGEEPFWVATIFARDEVTGSTLPGSAMEPVRMKLKDSTAARKRKEGKSIPDDNRVFDPFSRTKAIQKATRNALAAFIPERIEQSIIAMYEKDPSRVQRIQTDAEQKLEALPPALNDDEAKGLLSAARAAYDEIVWPEARVEFPPAKFGAWVMHTQHSHDSLRDLVTMVEAERDRLAAKYGGAS